MKDSLILVHAGPLETRVALVEDGRLAELFHEAEHERPLVGNIIKGRVTRVLPGMQAAFVDIGLDKAGFLYVGEIDTGEGGGDSGDGGDGDEDRDDDEVATEDAAPRGRLGSNRKIEDLLREGEEVLVQIIKAPIGTKGARLTGYLTIAGRQLVLSPGQTRVGVSRKIRFAKERQRLRGILDDLKTEGIGLIARTVAEGRSAEDLRADRDYLARIWQAVQRRASEARAPTVVYQELTMPLRIIRDVLGPRYSRILVDDAAEFDRVRRFLEAAIPARANDVFLYDEPGAMFEAYGIETQFRDALKPHARLPSGGGLVIEETEALTSIDVNTGRFVGSRNLEDTVLKTNLEAVREIARQARLRNLGGILILDFIDMDLAENRTKVYNTLKEELRHDRARTSILKISELGLVEMTRQRLQESLTRAVGAPCPHCHGRGYLTQPRVIVAALWRRLLELATESPGGRFVVRAHPWVTDWLFEEALPILEGLETQFSCRFRILPDPSLPEEEWTVAAESPSRGRSGAS